MKPSNSRRNFLKISTSGLAGLLALSKAKAIGSFSNEQKIITRVLGKTGFELPVISSGAIPVDNDNLAKAILKSGIVHIDTAHVYHNGKNEEVLGKILKDFNRDDFVIATKLYGKYDKKSGIPSEEEHVKKMEEEFEISLKRLGVDQVDILYLHAIKTKEAVLHEPYLKLFKKIKESGKAKYIGVSTHRNEPEVIDAAIESKVYDVVLTAINFKKDKHVEITRAINDAAKAGLGVVAMKVFAGGFLDKEKKKPVNKKAALKWVLQNENVHTAILSLDTFEDIETYWGIMNDLELTPEELKELEIQNKEVGLYCPGCNSCTSQCKKGLDVADIMRAYMYAYGYNNLKKSKDLLQTLDVSPSICDECEVCDINCPAGFDIKGKVKDIARLKSVPNDFLT